MQLAMREAVQLFLSDDVDEEPELEAENLEQLDENAMTAKVRIISEGNAFRRINATCRAIRAKLRRSHRISSIFESIQMWHGVTVTIQSDVPTRFDSALTLYESILKKKELLQRL